MDTTRYTKHSRNGTGNRGLTIVRALLLAAAVIVVTVLGYRQVRRMTEKDMPVWVSTGALTPGQAVSATNVALKQMPPPQGAIINRADIEGRTLLKAKTAGQPFYPADLAPKPPTPPLSATIPSGRLLATLRFESLDLPAQQLAAGDRIDVLLASTDGVHVVAHDAYVLGVLSQRAPASGNGDSGKILGVDISVPGAGSSAASGSALVLGLHPEEVFSLAAAEATGKSLKLVLHSEQEVKSGQVLDIRPAPAPPAAPSEPSVELLSGAKVETVHVR